MAILTLFDLDHTLIPLDSNQAWVEFLIDRGVLRANPYARLASAMEERYRTQTKEIDIPFCEFFIGTLTHVPPDELAGQVELFIERCIAPRVSAAAQELVAFHRAKGEILVMITATNRIITAPIARLFGIEHLIATEPETVAGRLTGKVAGTPSMRGGKVVRLDQWLAGGAIPGLSHVAQLGASCFYSDSINDLPLLEYVTDPVAVDPDRALAEWAKARSWPIVSLRPV
jgi:HAD superfamily hydrolase (TIGR01490 family)